MQWCWGDCQDYCSLRAYGLGNVSQDFRGVYLYARRVAVISWGYVRRIDSGVLNSWDSALNIDAVFRTVRFMITCKKACPDSKVNLNLLPVPKFSAVVVLECLKNWLFISFQKSNQNNIADALNTLFSELLEMEPWTKINLLSGSRRIASTLHMRILGSLLDSLRRYRSHHIMEYWARKRKETGVCWEFWHIVCKTLFGKQIFSWIRPENTILISKGGRKLQPRDHILRRCPAFLPGAH